MTPRLAALACAALLLLTACGAQRDANPTPATSTTATPDKPSALALTGLQVGDEPAIAWSRDRLLNGDADKQVLPEQMDQFVQTKQLLVMRDVDGNVFAYSPDGPASTTPIGKASGDLAVNEERTLVAWVAPDGSPTVLQEGEAKPATLLGQDGVKAGDAVAVLGQDCFNGPETVEGAGCQVYFRGHTEKPPFRSFISSNHGFVEPIEGGGGAGMNLQDADETGQVGWTSLDEKNQSTCSAYTGRETLDADTATSWRTCEHLPLAFSPDGRHVLATGPHGYEGLGASSLTILDRASGKPKLTLTNNARTQAAIVDMVWEDDAHVLAVITQRNDWAIVRVGLDGSMELAGDDATILGANEELGRIPFKLGVQP